MTNAFKKEESKKMVTLYQDRDLVAVSQGSSLPAQVAEIQTLTAVSPMKRLRRGVLCWLRIYVNESDGTRVNLHIPIPIPLLGLLLPDRLPSSQALRLRRVLANSADPAQALEDYLDSHMALELIRVDDDGDLVIIGID